MPIRVALHHRTEYRYDREVALSPQIIRLRPSPHCRTTIAAYSLKIEPGGHFINWQQDPQNNYLARVVFPEAVNYFSVEVDLIADLVVINPFDFFLEPYAEKVPFTYESALAEELRPYLFPQPPGPLLLEFLDAVERSSRRAVDFLVSLNQRVQSAIGYVIRLEPGIQTCEETLRIKTGSCRDSAWLLVQILRNLGLAARFVSGYLIQLKPDIKPLEGPEGPAQDFTDLHAWAEVYLPGAGWIGLDPTSGMFAGEGHIPLAAAPEPFSASPITGTVGPCRVEFKHEMSVTRLQEDPRVTMPYTEEQWNLMQALGHQVDGEISAGDIRLTMGGEPTFVSIDDMEGAEWNVAALGPHKRRLAEKLFLRLQKRFAPGGLLHYGQGKWYPGETLPRWALTCYWRRDGIPIWRDLSLIAGIDQPSSYGPLDAQRFAAALAARLGLDPSYTNPAFEDPLYYIQREHELPINVDPLDNRLEDASERDRIRQVFQRGLYQPVGYVLPLQRGWGKEGPEWQTGLWMLRGQHVYLVPGDSPAGLRLPMASLPWADPTDAPASFIADPTAPRGALPTPLRTSHASPQVQVRTPSPRDQKPAGGESASWIVRTALCVEPREGRLHVFLPPMATADDFIDLVAAVEDTAADSKIPAVIEGYPPPPDHRLLRLSVTPDPGVIEVNVHPARNWAELVSITTGLYEDARECRLGTEKFMLDGRHTGTGGGNHFALGGATPGDSPFLRRPDLLRSMLAYWINHPALSYLFSGLFIGPTSQAPRVDEARTDNLYELEIAFSEIPDPVRGYCPPWLVDRIFRHILVDITGNTHRAEFCIDKLYSPDSASGRLGLVEMRGFEMPPHERMSLTQQLLVRALVAWFWREPYLRLPISWGTQLHDQFMLRHFVAADFQDVVTDLRRAGYPFEAEWFAPHFEFRYPILGRVTYAGITIELSQATEPWYVLGEEPNAGAMSRFVDSSVERMQVRVKGLSGERYLLTCNGRRLPLHETGLRGEWVGGVRYRAWQPAACLHPTIAVHGPLVFDLYDSWSGRSVGGCTYHVAHPGGRAYETFPINANEAEARRATRFIPFGHTPGSMRLPAVEVNPQFPYTLDLRRTPIYQYSSAL